MEETIKDGRKPQRHEDTKALPGKPTPAALYADILEKLEEQHSALFRSFLKAVDPLLKSWEEPAAALGDRR